MQACWATIALALNTVQAWHSSRGLSISSLDAMRYGLSGPCSRSKVLQTAQTVLRFPARPAGIPLVRQLVTHLTWLHHLLTRTLLLKQAYEMPLGDMSVLEPFARWPFSRSSLAQSSRMGLSSALKCRAEKPQGVACTPEEQR